MCPFRDTPEESVYPAYESEFAGEGLNSVIHFVHRRKALSMFSGNNLLSQTRITGNVKVVTFKETVMSHYDCSRCLAAYLKYAFVCSVGVWWVV